MTYLWTADSPIGPLTMLGDGERLAGLRMAAQRHAAPPPADAVRDSGPFAAVTAQLEAYFAGERRSFDLPVHLHGTPFQVRVWQALREIPYGTTTTYGALARRLGSAGAVRAVGLANGRNPIAIVVPCHRVVGADGSLTGYAGGLDRKRYLLGLESSELALALDA